MLAQNAAGVLTVSARLSCNVCQVAVPLGVPHGGGHGHAGQAHGQHGALLRGTPYARETEIYTLLSDVPGASAASAASTPCIRRRGSGSALATT